jgi:hypothetical protein
MRFSSLVGNDATDLSSPRRRGEGRGPCVGRVRETGSHGPRNRDETSLAMQHRTRAHPPTDAKAADAGRLEKSLILRPQGHTFR